MDLKIYIEEDHGSYQKKIWVIENRGSERLYYTAVKGNIEVTTVHSSTIAPQETYPFLVMDRRFSDSFLKILVESLMKSGVEIESESKLKGELDATKIHLSDMKKIAFKLLKVE